MIHAFGHMPKATAVTLNYWLLGGRGIILNWLILVLPTKHNSESKI